MSPVRRHAETSPVPGFVDPFDALEPGRWRRSGPWANGPVFGCGWCPDHAGVEAGQLVLRLSDAPASGRPFSGGEIASVATLRYGRVEARMKPVSHDGVVTALFTYTGPSEGLPHHEIDIEFTGNDTSRVQLGYFTDGVPHAVEVVALGFDAAEAFHTYAFEWGPRGITWFVDGAPVKHADGAQGPLPSEPQRVFANVWPVHEADGWAGRFCYPGAPLTARYDYIAMAPEEA